MSIHLFCSFVVFGGMDLREHLVKCGTFVKIARIKEIRHEIHEDLNGKT
jgi:hypothetical protein